MGNSQPISPALKRAIIAFLLIAMIVLVFAPADKAAARRVHTNDYAHQHDWDQYRLDKIEVPVKPTEPISPDFTFKDEESGACLYHYPEGPSDGETNSEEFIAPGIETIVVNRDEECLHAEGTCKACDELREMFRNGEVNALYRVAFSPEINVDGNYLLSVPLDTWVSKYAVFSCNNGSLEPHYMTITTAVAERGFTTARVQGSMDEIQSPFGIAYNKSRPEESKNIAAHAYTPDDDDDDDDSDTNWLDILLNIAAGIGFFIVLAGIAWLADWFWNGSKIKW